MFFIYIQSILDSIGVALIFKHVLLFGLLTWFAQIVISEITKRLLIEGLSEKKENKIIVLRSTIFILSIILIVGMQVNYINKREVLEVYSCQYYDEYNNLIHTNVFSYTCPDLEIETLNDNEFTFSTSEQITSHGNHMGIIGLGVNAASQVDEVEVLYRTDTTVRYNDENEIVEYDFRFSLKTEYIIDGDILHEYLSKHRQVTNTYDILFFETKTKTSRHYEKNIDDFDLKHYDFNEIDYQVERTYTSEMNFTDRSLPDYTIINEKGTGDSSESEVVREVYKHESDGDISVNFMIELENDEGTHDITEISTFGDSYGDYIRLSSRRSNARSGFRVNFYSLFTQKKPDWDKYIVFNESGLNGSGIEEPESYISYYNIIDTINDRTYYTNNENIYEFNDTNYGTKITQYKRGYYRLFSSLEKQKENASIGTMNYSLDRVQDYKYEIERTNIYSTSPIIIKINPFCLE